MNSVGQKYLLLKFGASDSFNAIESLLTPKSFYE